MLILGIICLILAWLSFMWMAMGMLTGSAFVMFWGGMGLMVFGLITRLCLRKTFGG